ncbi:hypothetical protein E4S40_13020 [Algoriphagus kandeliae]|uniref:Uncharacterized protein n=1 Tax=Algoriphagus kandeliae TaxID=2562278 RepID=A0A4Y9QLQ0_9BACT|nr:hypothetical protein [Algoriphagus kandeliae]TFV93180.1 hypothetical protein E4S40_13020 [Algoriphagus kandeliae]
MDSSNYWHILIIAFIAWLVWRIISNTNKKKSLDNFKQSVIKYKIIEKYDQDPKWATYLYFDNGKEGWNKTIPGSFLAKDPETDLTFVHYNKEDALRYAQNTFINAKHLDE